jgi:ParB family chromosome partitioning protein
MNKPTQVKPLSEDKLRDVLLEDLEKGEGQVRIEFKPGELEALIESIKTNGQVEPILITKGKGKKYQIVNGERRWEAFKKIVEQAKKAGDVALEQEHLKIRAAYLEGDSQLLGILANLARNEYNPMEMAEALKHLKESLEKKGMKADDTSIGKLVGKSRTSVVGYNSLLKLPEYIRDKAKKESCVPLNRLISLATSIEKKKTEKKKEKQKEKVEERTKKTYDKLHTEYFSKPDDEATDKVRKPINDARRITLIHSKFKTLNHVLLTKTFSDIDFAGMEANEKKAFKESVESAITNAQELLKKLQQEPD